MTLLDQLTIVSNAYCASAGISRARVATIIFDHGAKFDLIDAGRDINTRTYERAMAWFSIHWPEDLAWPDGVDRPDPAEAHAQAEEVLS